jgi:hypothetical protein
MAVSANDTDIQESRCRSLSQCTGALSVSQGSESAGGFSEATRNATPYSNHMDDAMSGSVVSLLRRLGLSLLLLASTPSFCYE